MVLHNGPPVAEVEVSGYRFNVAKSLRSQQQQQQQQQPCILKSGMASSVHSESRRQAGVGAKQSAAVLRNAQIIAATLFCLQDLVSIVLAATACSFTAALLLIGILSMSYRYIHRCQTTIQQCMHQGPNASVDMFCSELLHLLCCHDV
jgi:hypothetical protein